MSHPSSNRDPLDGVSALFYERWSPRAFANAEIDDATVARLIDAARWSPSCFNAQPWRFYTANASSNADRFAAFLNLLLEGNQSWAKDASVLGFIVAKKHFEHNGKPNPSYALDCGAAWMAMTLQARQEGLYTHGMAGIKHTDILEHLGLDAEQHEVVVGFTIGKKGDVSQLDQGLQEKEFPSPRKPLDEVWLPS
ncbi:nitroreductase family protein [Zhongshania sp. BJYM1]|uniref:nitroreductase family protein n=1 Tax=Zhongshania aquatica TaxID=2965069 RepID=UPI0022B34AD6|nr:nitroreductase family protein [Marortus sp. BJYM1]